MLRGVFCCEHSQDYGFPINYGTMLQPKLKNGLITESANEKMKLKPKMSKCGGGQSISNKKKHSELDVLNIGKF